MQDLAYLLRIEFHFLLCVTLFASPDLLVLHHNDGANWLRRVAFPINLPKISNFLKINYF